MPFSLLLSSFISYLYSYTLLYASYYLYSSCNEACSEAFSKMNWLVLAVLWTAYEYLRTKGFLGYSYGVIGYSQYLLSPLVGLSSLTGVWGVSFLIIIPSSLSGYILRNGKISIEEFYFQCRKPLTVYLLILSAVLYTEV